MENKTSRRHSTSSKQPDKSCGLSYQRREALLARDDIIRAVCDVFRACPWIEFPLTPTQWEEGAIQCMLCGGESAVVWCRGCGMMMCASCGKESTCTHGADLDEGTELAVDNSSPAGKSVRRKILGKSMKKPHGKIGDDVTTNGIVVAGSTLMAQRPHKLPLLVLPQSFRAQERIQIYVCRHTRDTPFLTKTLIDQISARIGLDTNITVDTKHQDEDVHVLEICIQTIILSYKIQAHADYPSARTVLKLAMLCIGGLVLSKIINLCVALLVPRMI